MLKPREEGLAGAERNGIDNHLDGVDEACRMTPDELLPLSIVERLVCKAHVSARVAEIAIEADLHERTEMSVTWSMALSSDHC